MLLRPRVGLLLGLVFAYMVFNAGQKTLAQVLLSGPHESSSQAQAPLKATVPNVILISIDQNSSDLENTQVLQPLKSNRVRNDFTINGVLKSNNSKASVQCSLNTMTLKLSRGSSSINVLLRGTVGGRAISTRPTSARFTNKQADIVITGDIDDRTITSKTPLGNYRGTLMLNATIL